MRDILRPGDYVKCNGIEEVVQGPQDVQRFTIKDKWCDLDTMDLECYKMGKDYTPEANDWIPLIGKYAVMKTLRALQVRRHFYRPRLGRVKRFMCPMKISMTQNALKLAANITLSFPVDHQQDLGQFYAHVPVEVINCERKKT